MSPFIATTKYQRRHPGRGVVYRTIARNLPVLQTEQRQIGKSFPLFLHDEFSNYLEPGIPDNEFVRMYCYHCRRQDIEGRGRTSGNLMTAWWSKTSLIHVSIEGTSSIKGVCSS